MIDKELILFVSLNTNKNSKAVTALGRMLLQNMQLIVGKRYENERERHRENRPMVSVILDEFAPFAYSNFAQILQTARRTNTAFLFALQSLPQLLKVGRGFKDDVSSAPNTTMLLHTRDEETAQYFLKASACVRQKRRTLAVQRTGVFEDKYEPIGFGCETDIKETRAQDEHIKNLPVGQMQILMTDRLQGTLHSHLHVRAPRNHRFPGPSAQLHAWAETVRTTTAGNGGNSQRHGHSEGANGDVLREIERMEGVVGKRMYRGLLKSVSRVWNPKEIRDQTIQERVLAHMQAAERGLNVRRLRGTKLGLRPLLRSSDL